MTELVYGVLRTDGKIISIKDVPDHMSGLACNCICPNCRKELQACSLHGKVRPYFRHNNDSKTGDRTLCNPNQANETALHQLAKQIIKEEKKLFVPQKEIPISESGIRDISEEMEKGIPKFVLQNSVSIDAKSVELEKYLEIFTPDVFVKTEGEELFVEIFVSHSVNEDKKNKAIEYGTAMLEIDLSTFAKTPLSSDELRDIILNSEKHKRWIYYPVSQYELDQAKSYYKGKIEEYNKRTVKTPKPQGSTSCTKLSNDSEEHHPYSQRDRIPEEDRPYYSEIKAKFDRSNQSKEKIFDSRGVRWGKCYCCNCILLWRAIMKPKKDDPTLGICTMCYHR